MVSVTGRRGVRDDAMADRVIAADQDELLKRLGCPAFFQKPEQALYRDIHDLFRRFFDMSHVHHVRHALQAGCARFPRCERSPRTTSTRSCAGISRL